MSSIKDRAKSTEDFAQLSIKQAQFEAHKLTEYLKNLPEKEWLKQSFCTEWSIKDVAEHQAGWGTAILNAVRSGLTDSATFDFSEETMAGYQRDLSNLNRLEIAEQLTTTTDEIAALVERARPEQISRPVHYERYGLMTIAGLAGMRLDELALHSWDIRVTHDLTAKIHRESLPMVLQVLTHSIRFLVQEPVAELIAPITYLFELSGPVNGPVLLQFAPGSTVKVVTEETAEPDALVKIDGEAFLRLCWGRLRNFGWMIRDGWVKIEGSSEAVQKLPELFQGTKDYK